jgi:outer membrane protein TolC
MNGTTRVALAVALLVGAARGANGQESVRLTLDDAVTRAVANSQRLAELQAREDGAAAGEAGRQAARKPIVTALGGYTRTNHVDEFGISVPGQPLRIIYPDIPDNFRARVDLQWPIYTGGRTEALERAAHAERLAIAQDVAAARADLRLEVTRAYWALVTARETEAVLARSLESMDAHVRDLRARFEQGFIPPNDVLTAEAQQSRARLLAIEAANMRATAEADLRRLIGLQARERIEPVAPLAAADVMGESIERLLERARELRPERRAMAERLAAARARIDATAAGALPQLAVNGGYDYARPNTRIFPRTSDWTDSWDVSLNASWTLWDGGRRRAEQAEAAAGVRAIEARAVDLDRLIALEVEQRWLELDSSRAAVAASADGVRSAAEARRVVAERYRAGVVTSTDVLDAELALRQAELDRTRALANSRLAQSRLERAIGQ